MIELSTRNQLALLTRNDLNHEAVIRKAVDHIDSLTTKISKAESRNRELIEALKDVVEFFDGYQGRELTRAKWLLSESTEGDSNE